MMLPSFNFSSSYSPNPFLIVPSGIIISTWMLSGEAGSQWRNFVLPVGSSDTNEKSLGANPVLFDLNVRRCISL